NANARQFSRTRLDVRARRCRWKDRAGALPRRGSRVAESARVVTRRRSGRSRGLLEPVVRTTGRSCQNARSQTFAPDAPARADVDLAVGGDGGGEARIVGVGGVS